MGLLSFLGKKKEPELPPENPLEYYLEQRSAQTLLHAAESTLGVYIFVNKYYSDNGQELPKGITPGVDKYFISRDMDTLNEPGAEEIPKWYYSKASDYALTCEIVLKTAAQKGSGLAAFYLAMLYQFGVCGEENISMAESYFRYATTGDTPVTALVNIVDATKKDMWIRRDWTNNQDETLAMNLWMNNIMSSRHPEYVQSLTSEERRAYLFITSFLVFYFANCNGAWATGTLGKILCAYDTFVAKSEFHNFHIRFADNTLLGHDDPDLKIVGAVIKYELWQRGQNGDAFAKKWCFDSGVHI